MQGISNIFYPQTYIDSPEKTENAVTDLVYNRRGMELWSSLGDPYTQIRGKDPPLN